MTGPCACGAATVAEKQTIPARSADNPIANFSAPEQECADHDAERLPAPDHTDAAPDDSP